MSSKYQTLLAAARPLKKFTATVNGETLELQCRKLSQTEAQYLQEIWNTTYSDTFHTASVSDDNSAIYMNLKRQSKDRLANYVARADRLDFVADARLMFPDAEDNTDPRVQEEADRLMAQREAELIELDYDAVMAEAMKRRAHIQGLMAAGRALTQGSAYYAIYNDDGTRFFENMGQVAELDDETLDTLVKASSEALEVPKESPLS